MFLGYGFPRHLLSVVSGGGALLFSSVSLFRRPLTFLAATVPFLRAGCLDSGRAHCVSPASFLLRCTDTAALEKLGRRRACCSSPFKSPPDFPGRDLLRPASFSRSFAEAVDSAGLTVGGFRRFRASSASVEAGEMGGAEREAAERLAALRRVLSALEVDALLVEDSDPHCSEVPAAHFARRRFLTDFTGSFGLALVSSKEALLWTDGRWGRFSLFSTLLRFCEGDDGLESLQGESSAPDAGTLRRRKSSSQRTGL